MGILMCPSDRKDMTERYSDPTGAVLILSNATHTGTFDCRNEPSTGIESLFQSRETEHSHTTAIRASSRDVVELASIVRQVPIGTRSLVLIGEVGREKTRFRAME
jgi:hypothetical protein